VKVFKFFFLGWVVFALLVSGCTITINRPGTNPQAPAATFAGSPTPVVSPTRTPEPTATAYPTPTRRPTSTEQPALTQAPGLTQLPSLTPKVFVEQGQGPTPTASQTSAPLGNFTVTPPAMKCEVRETFPAFGQEFKPRTEFTAFWRVANIGAAPWGLDDVLFEYVAGDKLQINRDRESTYIGYTVYVNDKISIKVRMESPKAPGRYSTTWGLRRSNKKEPFCLFSFTIDVVK
jgi:hypothetical protein